MNERMRAYQKIVRSSKHSNRENRIDWLPTKIYLYYQVDNWTKEANLVHCIQRSGRNNESSAGRSSLWRENWNFIVWIIIMFNVWDVCK